MRSFILALVPVLASLALALALDLKPCRLEHPAGLSSVAAECGTLPVPEFRGAPGAPARDQPEATGRQIGLFVARVPAVSARGAADPLFILAGGPGAAASEFYAATAPAFASIHRDRDIILVDQRGTGRSNALRCEFDDDTLLQASGTQLADLTRDCLAQVSRNADPAQYTTSAAVVDLERVRQALGYEHISLYGVSYGTRVAQHYARRHGDRVRALILDGVVPPQQPLGPAIALDAEAALQSVLGRCAKDPDCREAFGDPVVDYRALRAQLADRPAGVLITSPRTGERLAFDFTPVHLAMVLRLSIYSSDQAALLPLSLHEAHMQRNFTPLGAQFLMTSDAIGSQLAFGMHNSVVCTEDAPRFASAAIDREKLATTFMGTAQLDGLVSLCSEWPRGPIDADFHDPLRAAVPTLLLSGGADPVTPASGAQLVAKSLPRSLSITVPDMGHGQIGTPCIDRLMAAFVRAGDLTGLDAGCVTRLAPMPFFTTLTGPPP